MTHPQPLHHGGEIPQKSPGGLDPRGAGRETSLLLPEYLFHITRLFLDFACGLIGIAPGLKALVAGRLAHAFLHFAFEVFCRAFCFVLIAGFHFGLVWFDAAFVPRRFDCRNCSRFPLSHKNSIHADAQRVTGFFPADKLQVSNGTLRFARRIQRVSAIGKTP